MTWLDIFLHQDTTSLRRLLEALGAAIKRCSDQIDRAANSGNEDYADAVTEAECGVIEDLLGTAFVGCQIFITATVSGTRHFQELSNDKSAHEKATVLGIGSPTLASTNYTRVQVIDALANYFKHRDEWTGEWAALTGRAGQTISIIRAAGATQGNTGNLRTAAQALGVSDYGNLEILHNTIQEWCDNVWNAYRLKINEAHDGDTGSAPHAAS
jgi:hypothetical protein